MASVRTKSLGDNERGVGTGGYKVLDSIVLDDMN